MIFNEVTRRLFDSAVKKLQGNIDNIQTTSRATLSTAGWYRVAEYKGIANSVGGYYTNGCELIIRRISQATYGEMHVIRLMSIGSEQKFVSESDISGGHRFTKCRYTYEGTAAYLEVYYSYSEPNGVHFTVVGGVDSHYCWQAITPTLTSENVDGVTVTTTYDIPANASPVTETDGNITVDTGNTGKKSTVTAKNDWGSASLFTGTTGNHGVYSDTFEKWIIRMDKATGEVYIDPTALANYFKNTGGTIDGNVSVQSSKAESRQIDLRNSVRRVYQTILEDGTYYLYDGTNGKGIIQSNPDGKTIANLTATGNLPLNGGGTVQANSTTPLGVKNTASATGTIALIAFAGTVGKLGGLGFKNTNQPVFQYSEGGTEDILHTGNSAKVAFTESDTEAPSDTTALWAHL
jgi:hypothetical protein